MLKYDIRVGDGMESYNIHFPIELSSHIYLPDENAILLSLKFSGGFESVPLLFRTLKKAGKIVSSFFILDGLEDEAKMGCFITLDKGIKPEDVLKELRGLKFVLEAKVSTFKLDSLAFDTLHFPLLTCGERCVVLTLEGLKAVSLGLRERFGSAGEFLLYEMGIRYGEYDAINFAKKYRLSGLTAVRAILAEAVGRGWCYPRIVEFDEKRLEGVLVVRDLFECLPYKGSQTPISHFFRGYLCGIFSYLFSRDFTIREKECVGKGDSECIFTVTPRVE